METKHTPTTVAASEVATMPDPPKLERANSNPLLDCPVCYACDIRQNLMVIFEPCGHPLCRPCAVGLVRDQLGPKATGVFCPQCQIILSSHPPPDVAALSAALASELVVDDSVIPAIPSMQRQVSAARPVMGSMSENYMRRLQLWSARNAASLPAGLRPLSVEDVKRFVTVMLEEAVRKSGRKGEKTLRCPSAACGLLFIVEDCTAQVGYCPYCTTGVCVHCGFPWGPAHSGRSCEAAAVAYRDEMMDAVLVRRQGATFRCCPSCNEAITHYHEHGCHHMTCSCGEYFCYTCGQPLGEYDHDDESCPQFCDTECACPPCPECRANKAKGAFGCDSCEGGCKVCAGLVGEEVWADEAAESAPTASALGHTGAWRQQLGAFWCSLPETPDGPQCAHRRPRILEVPHWSCCGVLDRMAACAAAVPTTAATTSTTAAVTATSTS